MSQDAIDETVPPDRVDPTDQQTGLRETVLVVDDEESIRATFREWLESTDLNIEILTAADAETALNLANEQTIDLSILDWNLGAGNDGLQLLEDLYLFNPDVVAIMITGFAHQATPLDAMRMGVRDYFDKNSDLTRERFLQAVKSQLDFIRPAKREKRLHHSLLTFRQSIEQVLPLVQSAATLNDPAPLPEAIKGLFRFLIRATQAGGGALLFRSFDEAHQKETYRAYNPQGEPIVGDLVPFSRSLAGTILSMGRAQCIASLTSTDPESLHSFEKGRTSFLGAPLVSDPDVQVIVELFDKQNSSEGFSGQDRELVESICELSGHLFRHSQAGQKVQRLLFDAIEAALQASDRLQESLQGGNAESSRENPSSQVLDQLQESLRSPGLDALSAQSTVQLAEVIRELAVNHGESAIEHCLHLMESLRTLLDQVSGMDEDQA